MKTVTINIYQFSELSDEAKEKAINNLSDSNVDSDWWDSICEDAAQVNIKIKSFDIDRGSYLNAKFIESAYNTANLIILNHGESCETYKTAKTFINDYNELVCKYSDGIKTDIVAEGNEYNFDNEAEDLENDFLQSISEDYRIILSNEYDYLTSETAIIETIEANEYYFYSDGKLANCVTYTGKHEKAGTTELTFKNQIYTL